MNNSIAAYAGKGKNYAGTASLLTRVHVAACVQLVGYHYFWTSVLDALQVKIPRRLHLKFLSMDKEKVVRFHRDHEFKSKAKRKSLEHKKLNALFVQYQKDVARNATYKSQTGCDDMPTTKKTRKTKTNTCLHSKYGCEGKKGHKTEQSKHCNYHASKLGGLSLQEAQQRWIEQNENGSGIIRAKNFLFSIKIYNQKSKFVLFLFLMLTFVEEFNLNSTCIPVLEGISNEKNNAVPQIAKNADNSNLESASVVQDFDLIFQKI